MKIRVLLVSLAFVGSATTAMAAAGPYLGASAGVSLFHDSDVTVPGLGEGEIQYDAGGAVNVSLGYDFNNNFRAEAEIGYKAADVKDDSTDANITSYMLNGYYDFKTGGPATPFVGFGLGIINGEFEDGAYSVDDDLLGYQVSVGAAFNVTPRVDVDLMYRYQSAFDDFSVDGVDISYGSSNILAGIRYKF